MRIDCQAKIDINALLAIPKLCFFKRRLHIQFVERFGILFGPYIVPLRSKKFDPNI